MQKIKKGRKDWELDTDELEGKLGGKMGFSHEGLLGFSQECRRMLYSSTLTKAEISYLYLFSFLCFVSLFSESVDLGSPFERLTD